MKKILALVLALMLVLSTSVVAFAATSETNNGSAQGDVNIKITATDKDGEEVENPDDVDPEDAVYKVDIDLNNYTFTYNFGTYNTTDHTYSGGTGWDNTTESFNVKNHSNTKIGVTAKFGNSAATITDQGVTATIDSESFDLDSAVGTGSNPPAKDVTVTVSGAPTTATGWKISTVTLTFAGK